MNQAQTFLEDPIEPVSSPFRWFLDGPRPLSNPKGRYYTTDLDYVPKKRLGPRTKIVLQLLLVKPGMTIEEMKPTLGPGTHDLIWRIGKYEGLILQKGEKWFVSPAGEALFFSEKQK